MVMEWELCVHLALGMLDTGNRQKGKTMRQAETHILDMT